MGKRLRENPGQDAILRALARARGPVPIAALFRHVDRQVPLHLRGLDPFARQSCKLACQGLVVHVKHVPTGRLCLHLTGRGQRWIRRREVQVFAPAVLRTMGAIGIAPLAVSAVACASFALTSGPTQVAPVEARQGAAPITRGVEQRIVGSNVVWSICAEDCEAPTPKTLDTDIALEASERPVPSTSALTRPEAATPDLQGRQLATVAPEENGDKSADSIPRQPGTVSGTPAEPAGASAGPTRFDRRTIFFRLGRYDIDRAQQERLVSVLSVGLPSQVRVVGMTDGVGSPDANRQLAKFRASSAAAALAKAGLATDLLTVDATIAGEGRYGSTAQLGVASPTWRRAEVLVRWSKPVGEQHARVKARLEEGQSG
jgi:outer membrane protein OmpA-like peptidoglycan-associated protein